MSQINQSTPNQISPIRGVIVDVKMDELCTTTVMPAPMAMARYPVSQGTYGMSALIVTRIM